MMKIPFSFNRISVKLGVLFSGLFFSLFIILGFLLFQLFSHLFLDYVTQDLHNRGENHAQVLEGDFTKSTIEHVGLMEKSVITTVIITDQNGKILTSSDPYDQEMLSYIKSLEKYKDGAILNKEWTSHNYIVSVSPIAHGQKGFVFMYYPTSILKETVGVLQSFILIVSIGVIFIALGIITIISNRMTKPLLRMKEATSDMAKGKYQQDIQVNGEDELGQLGNSIQKLGEQLQYFEDTRNEFLAGISHELRTPLTYIQGYTDVLSKGLIKEEQEQKKYLLIIHEETKRVVQLVNDLFDMAQIQTGHYRLNVEFILLTNLLKKVVNHLLPSAHKKGLNMKLEIDQSNNVKILLDPLRIEQVFFNLIENAVKYTEQGEIRIRLEQKENNVRVTIQDTGIGIPKDELAHIWERFYRVEKSRARKTGGSGLGLYLVKEWIRLHSGTIDVLSEDGKGTTFIVNLPKKIEQ
ncbi:HAMP domain-containing sensor histidine kinase [Tepidibacillus marianensis]|uniref:sensor histidine kinase n=1 Tax=Tepidibacillus marianensis TaxID=3131995 RepID=UPI0030CCB96B